MKLSQAIREGSVGVTRACRKYIRLKGSEKAGTTEVCSACALGAALLGALGQVQTIHSFCVMPTTSEEEWKSTEFVQELYQQFPILYKYADHPRRKNADGTPFREKLLSQIIDLNDNYKWDFGKTADWVAEVEVQYDGQD